MSSLLAATSRRTALMAVHRVPTATVAAGAPTTVLASRVVSGGAVWAARGLSTKPPSTSGVLQMLHQYVYKRNSTYLVYVIIGGITLEMVYGKFTDSIWNSLNRGKQYHDIDWSVFKEEEEEEEEEEGEEEEEE